MTNKSGPARFALNPTMRLGKLKNECYIYELSPSVLKRFSHMKIQESLFDVLQKIEEVFFSGSEISRETMKEHLSPEQFDKVADKLTSIGYLIPRSGGGGGGAAATAAKSNEPKNTETPKQTDWNLEKIYGEIVADGYKYVRPTYFNVPADFPDEEADVLFVTIPFASKWLTQESEAGPDFLRFHTSENYNWFEHCGSGVYSETTLPGKPAVVCRDLVPKDFKTVDPAGKSLREIFDEVKETWASIRALKGKPIFIGGDHAITFPILAGLQEVDRKAVENLVVLHFDAHHDYYYGHGFLQYNHSMPFYNVIKATNVKKVISLGLRTFSETASVPNFEAAVKAKVHGGKLSQYGIFETTELLRQPEKLKALIPPKSDIYISIDLDVLDSTLVEGAVSTPVKDGMRWSELYRAVELAKTCGNVIGADLVEYSPCGRNAKTAQPELASLLITLMETLR